MNANNKRTPPVMAVMPTDIRLADVVVEYNSLKEAVSHLNVNPQGVYNRGRAIQRQLRKAIGFVDQVLDQCHRHPAIRLLWWPKEYESELQTNNLWNEESHMWSQTRAKELHVCQMCGNAERAVLELHHIDGNRNNNNDENLQLLCANHHRLIHRKQGGDSVC